MKCTEPSLSAQVLAWLEGALGPEEAARVEAHVNACASCRDEVAFLREVGGRLASAFAAQKRMPLGALCPSPEQLSDFVADLLDRDTAFVVGEHILVCPPCADEVALLRELGRDLAADLEEASTPPASLALRRAFEKEFGTAQGTTRGAPGSGEERGLLKRFARWSTVARRPLGAVATLAVVFGTAWLFIHSPETIMPVPPPQAPVNDAGHVVPVGPGMEMPTRVPSGAAGSAPGPAKDTPAPAAGSAPQTGRDGTGSADEGAEKPTAARKEDKGKAAEPAPETGTRPSLAASRPPALASARPSAPMARPAVSPSRPSAPAPRPAMDTTPILPRGGGLSKDAGSRPGGGAAAGASRPAPAVTSAAPAPRVAEKAAGVPSVPSARPVPAPAPGARPSEAQPSAPIPASPASRTTPATAPISKAAPSVARTEDVPGKGRTVQAKSPARPQAGPVAKSSVSSDRWDSEQARVNRSGSAAGAGQQSQSTFGTRSLPRQQATDQESIGGLASQSRSQRRTYTTPDATLSTPSAVARREVQSNVAVGSPSTAVPAPPPAPAATSTSSQPAHKAADERTRGGDGREWRESLVSRARQAAAGALQSQQFSLQVSVVPSNARRADEVRCIRVRVTVPAGTSVDVQARIRSAVSQALHLNPGRGDAVTVSP